ncbi:MAG: hypothetical protein ACI9KE_002631 [Polyangiales bacterium]|jgi:hypothetical protein
MRCEGASLAAAAPAPRRFSALFVGAVGLCAVTTTLWTKNRLGDLEILGALLMFSMAKVPIN